MERTDRAAAGEADGYSGDGGLMRNTILVFVVSMFASVASAQDCPASADAQSWHKMGCDFATDPEDLFAAVPEFEFKFDPSTATASEMIWQLDKRSDIVALHYQASFEELKPRIIGLLEKNQLQPISEETFLRIKTISEEAYDGNDGQIWAVVEALEPIVVNQGKHLVYIESSTDLFSFGILATEQFCAWNMTWVSDYVAISQLKVTPAESDTSRWPMGPRDCRGKPS